MLFTAIDLETTGTDPDRDAIVEIAAVDIVDGAVSDKPRMSLVNPGRPIPPESSAVHHIIASDVEKRLAAKEIVPDILRPNSGAIFVSHNSAFEEGFLKRFIPGARWLCTYKSALRLYPEAPSHSLQVLRYWLNLDVDREIADQSHRAFPDALTCAYLLLHLLEMASVDEMLAWTREPPLLPTCPIGKQWRGKKWSECDYGFLSWILGNVDDQNIVWNAKHELERRAKQQEAEREVNKIRGARGSHVMPEPGHEPMTGRDRQGDAASLGLEIPSLPADLHSLDSIADRESYVKFLIAIIKFTPLLDYEELKSLYSGQANNFQRFNITKGDTDYQRIVDACKARREELAKPQEQIAA